METRIRKGSYIEVKEQEIMGTDKDLNQIKIENENNNNNKKRNSSEDTMMVPNIRRYATYQPT